MKSTIQMCKVYHNRARCAGYRQGMCFYCSKFEVLIGYRCDICGTEADTPDELYECGEKHLCKDCMEKLNEMEEH